MNRLDPIVAATREELARRREVVTPAEVEAAAARRIANDDVRDFAGALARPGLSVIAEHKRRSPSAGPIREDLVLEDVVGAYERGGAAALSILTEGPSFGGSLDDLRAARAAVGLPLLRKDFIVDPYQVHESFAAGADAILLIVAALPAGQLAALHSEALSLGLSALVEVHDGRELDIALALGAAVIGINNRDLKTLEVDTARTFELLPRVAGQALVVSESGFSRPAQLEELARAGVDGVLIGEALMRSPDVEAACRAARPALSPNPPTIVGCDQDQVLRDHHARRRRARRERGRVGNRVDLLASFAEALPARACCRDRRGGQTPDRGRGRIRQRDARLRRPDCRRRRPDHAPVPRRRGTGVLRRGGPADRLPRDQGGAGARPGRRAGADPVPHRLSPARQLLRGRPGRNRRDLLVGDRPRSPRPGAGDPVRRTDARQRRRRDRRCRSVRGRCRQRRRARARSEGSGQARRVCGVGSGRGRDRCRAGPGVVAR